MMFDDQQDTHSSKLSSKESLLKADYYLLMVLIVLSILVYGQVAYHQTNGLDDHEFIGNKHVLNGLTKETILWALSTTHMAIWHPTTWLSYLTETNIFGAENHGARHLVNLLLHILTTVICYCFTKRLFSRISDDHDFQSVSSSSSIVPMFGAFFVAFLFAFHPQHVQVLAWLSERKELLAALFSMLAIYAHIRGKLIMAFVWFAISLTAKASALPMAFVIVSYDLIFKWGRYKQLLAKRWVYYAGLITLALSLAFLTLVSQNSLNIEAPEVAQLAGKSETLLQWLGYIALSLGHYLKTLFLSWPLPIYIHRPDAIEPTVLLQSLAWIVAAIGLLFVYRNNRWVLFGAVWFTLFWLPTSGLVSIGDIYVADRYMYQAHIGAFIVLFAILLSVYQRLSIPKWLIFAGLTPVFLLALYFSWLQTSYWETSITFYERELEINPESDGSLIMLGREHQYQEDLVKSKYYYDQLLQRNPYGYYGNMYSGFLNMHQGNYDLAIQQLTIAVQQGKVGSAHYLAEAYQGLAWTYAQSGKQNLAVRLAISGLKKFPDNEYLQKFVVDKGDNQVSPDKLAR